jgi:hypothetical protein
MKAALILPAAFSLIIPVVVAHSWGQFQSEQVDLCGDGLSFDSVVRVTSVNSGHK